MTQVAVGAVYLIQSYRERYLPRHGRILDIYSSHNNPPFPACLRCPIGHKEIEIYFSGPDEALLRRNTWRSMTPRVEKYKEPYVVTDLNSNPYQLVAEFESYTPFAISFSAYRFDAITNFSTIQCMERPIEVLCGLFEIAKTDGTIHLVVGVNSRLDEFCTRVWREAYPPDRLLIISDLLQLAN
jgi:hypothetical protein